MKTLTPMMGCVLLAPIAGLCCIVVPPYLISDMSKDAYYASLLPFIGKGLANSQYIPTIILLFLTGSILGYLQPRIWYIVGSTTLIIFPLLSIIEMIKYPTSHNLFPFELILWGISTWPSFLGAAVGSRIKVWLMKRKRNLTNRSS